MLKKQNQELKRQIQTLQEHEIILPKGIRGSAAVEGNIAYFRIDKNPYVYEYDSSKSKWLCIYPKCPFLRFGIAVINGLLTAVGGLLDGKVVGTLLSLTGEGTDKEWSDSFSPMPTERLFPGILRCGTSLIVAGGTSTGYDSDGLATVEVMNTETSNWSIARSLPSKLVDGVLTTCGDNVYMLGGNVINKKPSNLLFTSSLKDLCKPGNWDTIAKVPVCSATCATVNGQLLAVGGQAGRPELTADGEEKQQYSSSIYAFDPIDKSWEFKCNMETARSFCLAAALPNNNLIVVAGFIQGQDLHAVKTNNFEIVSLNPAQH